MTIAVALSSIGANAAALPKAEAAAQLKARQVPVQECTKNNYMECVVTHNGRCGSWCAIQGIDGAGPACLADCQRQVQLDCTDRCKGAGSR